MIDKMTPYENDNEYHQIWISYSSLRTGPESPNSEQSKNERQFRCDFDKTSPIEWATSLLLRS